MRLILPLFILAWSSLAWPATAGKVDLVTGDVRCIAAGSQEKRPLKLADTVNEGDTLLTGPDGEVLLAMEDGGQLALHANSQMRIDQYQAEGSKTDTSILNLLQGAMRSVTGWIGKYNPRRYEVRTPTATIGVRGTDHETRVIPEGSSEGPAGTYDKVNIGATEMRTAQGSTRILPNRAGFVPAHGRVKPKLLDRIPGFFRPLQHSKRFEGLHERVRQNIDHNRGQRIKQRMEQKNERKKLEQQHQKQERQRAEKMQQPNKAKQHAPAKGLRALHGERKEVGQAQGRGKTRPQTLRADQPTGHLKESAHEPQTRRKHAGKR
ncbi:MAG: FecR protein [Betaproteobacteria bacterium ADurb.Bin341]|nr:MAG: FecR protein [Betaproteobacteria bacterium ADurb.Bin341]